MYGKVYYAYGKVAFVYGKLYFVYGQPKTKHSIIVLKKTFNFIENCINILYIETINILYF